MSKAKDIPLTGCCDMGVLCVRSANVHDVYTEADHRAELARALADAIPMVERTTDDGTELLHAAAAAISALIGDAIGLYRAAHGLQRAAREDTV